MRVTIGPFFNAIAENKDKHRKYHAKRSKEVSKDAPTGRRKALAMQQSLLQNWKVNSTGLK